MPSSASSRRPPRRRTARSSATGELRQLPELALGRRGAARSGAAGSLDGEQVRVERLAAVVDLGRDVGRWSRAATR